MKNMLQTLNLTAQQVKEMSLFNVRKLECRYSTDFVLRNIFTSSTQMMDMMQVVFLNTSF